MLNKISIFWPRIHHYHCFSSLLGKWVGITHLNTLGTLWLRSGWRVRSIETEINTSSMTIILRNLWVCTERFLIKLNYVSLFEQNNSKTIFNSKYLLFNKQQVDIPIILPESGNSEWLSYGHDLNYNRNCNFIFFCYPKYLMFN